jgi:hypothetical protein
VIEHLLSFFDEDPVMFCLSAAVGRLYLKATITREQYQRLFNLRV